MFMHTYLLYHRHTGDHHHHNSRYYYIYYYHYPLYYTDSNQVDTGSIPTLHWLTHHLYGVPSNPPVQQKYSWYIAIATQYYIVTESLSYIHEIGSPMLKTLYLWLITNTMIIICHCCLWCHYFLGCHCGATIWRETLAPQKLGEIDEWLKICQIFTIQIFTYL